MRVVCITNLVGGILEPKVRDRIRRSINLEGPVTSLEAGRSYVVQALETRSDGGLWFYLQTVAESSWPYPYPAEMFELQDNSLPIGWSINLQAQNGNVNCKRITFAAWAMDDHFYERLVEGDVETVSLYRRLMLTD